MLKTYTFFRRTPRRVSRNSAFLLWVLPLFLLTATPVISQTCPVLPGGHLPYTFAGGENISLYPGNVPDGAPIDALEKSTAGVLELPTSSISEANKATVTIRPTLNGTDEGKVLFNLFALNFNANTVLRIYQGTDATGTPLVEITTDNQDSELGKHYMVTGPATVVAFGSSSGSNIRFVTGDRELISCKAGRPALIWDAFITPNSYVLIDDLEDEINNPKVTSNYNFLPSCMAYFDADKNVTSIESSFCLDRALDSPTTGYYYYPGEVSFKRVSSGGYDIDRSGTYDPAIDGLKTARILWLIEQGNSLSSNEDKNELQIAVWETQFYDVNYIFPDDSWGQQAQLAVPEVKNPAEPDFELELPDGEDGTAIVETETIQINIPFSWPSAQDGQTNTVKLEIPSDVTVVSVVGGTLTGDELVFTDDEAVLTLSSNTIGSYTIRAIYNNPGYFNVGNLQVYEPCDLNKYQSFLHVGEENPHFPFRSIEISWIQDPLPVRLVNFDLYQENHHVALNWTTAEEVNFSHFEIEKTSDLKSWYTLHSTPSNGGGRYSYVDAAFVTAPITYYRLKMVDMDGSYSHSTVKSVRSSLSRDLVVFHPNPARNFLKYTAPEGEVKAISLYDVTGVLKAGTQHFNASNTLDISGFADGIYLVDVQLNDGTSLRQKILIIK